MPVIQRLAAGGARGFGFGVGGVTYSGLITETATGADSVNGIPPYQGIITETAIGNDSIIGEPLAPGYASFAFNGASYFTTPSDPQFAVGTNNYFVEFFVYPYSINTNVYGTPLFDINWTYGGSTSSSGFAITLTSSTGNLSVRQATTQVLSSYPLSINTWYYVCVSRSGGTTRIFAAPASDTNTVQRASATTTYTLTQGAVYVGKFTSFSYFFNGLISNLRFVVGTGISSPPAVPTTPLTNITGTKLLTCQDLTVIDNSTANGGSPWTLTNSGTTTTSTNPL